jgi:hypothetical protein
MVFSAPNTSKPSPLLDARATHGGSHKIVEDINASSPALSTALSLAASSPRPEI